MEPIERPLLTYLRDATGDATLAYAEPPEPMTGGFENRIEAFRLATDTPGFDGSLIVRILPRDDDPTRVLRERAVHDAVTAAGFAAPRVLLLCEDPTVLGGPFLVMERLAGAPKFTMRITRTLAGTLARLHDIHPAPLLADASLAPGAMTLEARFGMLVARAERYAPGMVRTVEWFRDHQPPSREQVICHGDYHLLNVLMHDGEVSGVIDWSLAVVADPAFDLAGARNILKDFPLGLPGPIEAAIHPLRRIPANRLTSAYNKLRPFDASVLPYYECLRSVFGLLWTAGNRAGADPRPSPWDRPATIGRIARRISDFTGIEVEVPAPAR